MKYFDRDGKHNFIDENNVFVGYDSFQDCCENADWFYSSVMPKPGDVEGDIPKTCDTDGFNFDPEFFHDHGSEGTDEGGAVSFKLVNAAGESMYLTLFNHHNGYYGHGFIMSVGDAEKRKGTL